MLLHLERSSFFSPDHRPMLEHRPRCFSAKYFGEMHREYGKIQVLKNVAKKNYRGIEVNKMDSISLK